MKRNKLIKISILICVVLIVIIVITVNWLYKKTEEPSNSNNSNSNKNQVNQEFIVNPENNKPIENKSTIIEENEFNTFSIKGVTEQKLAELLLADYKKNMLDYPQDAYNLLDETYKNKRFGNLENYKEYINKNRKILEGIKLNKFLVDENKEYIQYVCLDQYDNYYIFRVLDNVSYTLLLDTHTINIPEFTKKYYSSDTQVKVGMNVEKFFDAINTKDYSYAYNVLAESFKGNFYKTQQEFENYIKTSLFEFNEVSYDKFADRGNTYIYEITVKDKVNETDTKKMTIIMQLKENTDFVMSFNIE